jgi:hypothetical protein
VLVAEPPRRHRHYGRRQDLLRNSSRDLAPTPQKRVRGWIGVMEN